MSVPIELTIKRGKSWSREECWASIEMNGISVFGAVVYDNPKNPAEQNILKLFASRLQAVLGEP